MAEKWYVATLLLQCKVGDQDVGPWTVEEQVRLIRASNRDSAYEKSIHLGELENQSYPNGSGETVYWEFIGLAELADLDTESIHDGIEIKSHFIKSTDPTQLALRREDLLVYWAEANRDRTANDILNLTDK
jgi:hypothetical protein